jgi:hypothetical protein
MNIVPGSVGHQGGGWPYVRVRLPVAIALRGIEAGALAKDLGVEGAFIESFDEPRRGDRLEVILRHPIVEQELRLSAVVRWLSASGFGVEFVDVCERGRRAVAALAQAFG